MTLFMSPSPNSSGTAQLLAVDPTTAAIKTQVQMRVATALHFGADSVWADGQVKDANGQYCSVTRYDAADARGPERLCASVPGFAGLTSMGDALWFIDETNLDTGTGAGAVLTQIDPATNAPGKSVPLPYSGGCCRDSQGAVFCSCGQSDVWRLTESDSAFVDLGNYSTIYPAGTGFWTEQDPSALLVDGPSSTTAVPLQVATHLVGGDAAGIYVQGEQTGQDVNYPLLRRTSRWVRADPHCDRADVRIRPHSHNARLQPAIPLLLVARRLRAPVGVQGDARQPTWHSGSNGRRCRESCVTAA